MLMEYYLEILSYEKMPKTIGKYLKVPSLVRLKKIGYFCGMDYASKDIYDFAEKITRFDHSISVALLTYKFTKDIKATLTALFHDVATPCFAHVIDYMNKDYSNQESTEEYTEKIIKSDEILLNMLKEDNIDVEEIISFKKNTIVDNKRPKMCADRLDGVILNSIGWTKNIDKDTIKEIIDSVSIYMNEENELELGFKKRDIAEKVVELSDIIDEYCHSNEDNYMMQLLAEITNYCIKKKYIKYEDLYFITEEDLIKIIMSKEKDKELSSKIDRFYNIKKAEIPIIELPNVKKRILNPIVRKRRLKK